MTMALSPKQAAAAEAIAQALHAAGFAPQIVSPATATGRAVRTRLQALYCPLGTLAIKEGR
ncbi:hypothetical protein FHS53_003964 [Xanthobacter tagetidis]|nr:hypothetical protein [Xanthobacter tagetidis]